MVGGGLDTGVLLWHLLQILSGMCAVGFVTLKGKTIAAIAAQPKMRIHMVNNLFVSFQFLEQEKIKIVGIGPEGTKFLEPYS
jgi:hypothetical protein